VEELQRAAANSLNAAVQFDSEVTQFDISKLTSAQKAKLEEQLAEIAFRDSPEGLAK
jgi:hypothetical protein